MKNHILIVIILLGVGLIFFVNYIPPKSVIGKYVNNNTEPILEGPNSIENGRDTLILYKNNIFESKTWGKGTYRIQTGIVETEIDLTYTSSIGKARFFTQISKSPVGKLRIWLNYDLGFFFEKID